ncbi:unnamed protein product, partial [Mesorhabditis spiculigera]
MNQTTRNAERFLSQFCAGYQWKPEYQEIMPCVDQFSDITYKYCYEKKDWSADDVRNMTCGEQKEMFECVLVDLGMSCGGRKTTYLLADLALTFFTPQERIQYCRDAILQLRPLADYYWNQLALPKEFNR